MSFLLYVALTMDSQWYSTSGWSIVEGPMWLQSTACLLGEDAKKVSSYVSL